MARQADGSTPKVSYDYENGSGNTIRSKSMTYPMAGSSTPAMVQSTAQMT